VFDFLRKYQIILVTGPQRSGTTICARMIEHDLDYTYLDEREWNITFGEEARILAEENWPCVLQGPGLLKDALLFNQPKCAVVLMVRSVEDIIASQNRVGWSGYTHEMSFYTRDIEWYQQYRSLDYWTGKSLDPDPRNDVAWIKYMYWYDKIRPNLTYRNWYEVEYKKLSSHPLWITKEERMNFTSRQWEI